MAADQRGRLRGLHRKSPADFRGVRHSVRCFAMAYLPAQTHLEPHPEELMLRNHA